MHGIAAISQSSTLKYVEFGSSFTSDELMKSFIHLLKTNQSLKILWLREVLQTSQLLLLTEALENESGFRKMKTKLDFDLRLFELITRLQSAAKKHQINLPVHARQMGEFVWVDIFPSCY